MIAPNSPFVPSISSKIANQLPQHCTIKSIHTNHWSRSREFTVSIDRNKMELFRKNGVGCCTSRDRRLVVESVSGGVDVMDAEVAEAKVFPEHLVFMVNGIIGSAADWRYAAEQFVKKLPEKVIVHHSECNYSKLTLDGVDLMGERLAKEVLDVVRRRPYVRKISLVAHSLGGLVARYAIGRLYSHSSKTKSSDLGDEDVRLNH